MQKVIMSAISSVVLLISGNAFATKISCPTENMVRAQSLASVYLIEHHYGIFTSNTFIDNSSDWRIMFTARLPLEIQKHPDAMRLAQEYFSKTPITMPAIPMTDRGVSICSYTTFDIENQPLGVGSVMAVHPANFES